MADNDLFEKKKKGVSRSVLGENIVPEELSRRAMQGSSPVTGAIGAGGEAIKEAFGNRVNEVPLAERKDVRGEPMVLGSTPSVPQSLPQAAGGSGVMDTSIQNKLAPSHGINIQQETRRRYFGKAPESSQGWIRNERTGEVFTAEDAQKGFSRPGGFGLKKGGGAYSAVDMSKIPAKRLDISVPSAEIGGNAVTADQITGSLGMRRGVNDISSIDAQAERQRRYGEKIFSPIDEQNRYKPSPAYIPKTGDARADAANQQFAESNQWRRSEKSKNRAVEEEQNAIARETMGINAAQNQQRYGLDAARAASDIATNQITGASAMADVQGKTSANALRQMLATERDPERARAIGERLALMSGNVQNDHAKEQDYRNLFGTEEVPIDPAAPEMGMVKRPVYLPGLIPGQEQGGNGIMAEGGGQKIAESFAKLPKEVQDKANAIKADKNLSREEKIKQLKALGL